MDAYYVRTSAAKNSHLRYGPGIASAGEGNTTPPSANTTIDAGRITTGPDPQLQDQGITRILQCRSGSAKSSNAAPTPSNPTSPVISGATSIAPSAIARSDMPNSSGS